MNEILGGLGVFWVLFLVVLALLWFILPFAVFGIKDRLDKLIKEQATTNKLLTKMTEKDKQVPDEPAPSAPLFVDGVYQSTPAQK